MEKHVIWTANKGYDIMEFENKQEAYSEVFKKDSVYIGPLKEAVEEAKVLIRKADMEE